MRGNLLSRAIVLVLGLGLVLGLTPGYVYPLSYPHNELNSISCSSCHFEHGGQPGFMPPWTEHDPQNIDDTPYNTLCWSCHNDIEAPYVRTHSSLTTDDKYGDWTVECKACHDPHRQMQFFTYGDASFLYSGESTSITASTIVKSGAGWSVNQYQGLAVVPNTSEVYYNYEILSNTEDTLNVQGPLDLSKVAVGDTFAIIYGKLIKSTIPAPQRDTCEVVDNQYVCEQTVYRMVKFFNDTGPNSFADGDTEYDGVCEVCHTQTTHFQYSGGGSDQLHDNVGGAAGQDCIDCHSHINGFGHGGGAGAGCESCHGHDAGYEYEPGKFSEGRGTFKSHSTHTENDSDDLRGPNVTCDACHDVTNFPYFKSGTDSNGDGQYELSETDVCDVCHSPGGAFDGVNDASYGAKNNWADGVYDGDDLKAGKEKWCASCHDSGASVAQGVQAPNVAGDDATWGYYATGHGRNQIVACLDCHDSTTAHIDGEPRTYSVASDNYQAGYRLASVGGQAPMRVPINYLPPRDGRQQPEDYRLCFSCHDQYQVLGDIGRSGTSGDWLLSSWGTNFREEEGVSPLTDVQNGHYVHVGQPGPFGPARSWDSDWDGAVDSAPSCPTCHNVHGSPSPAMLRHGELISTPGTGDKIPALDFRWYEEDGSTVTTNLADSRWGQMPPMEDPGPIHLGQSHVCDSCHGGPNSTKYYREPVESTTGTCVGCHSTAQDNGDGNPPGGRRAVVDEFGYSSHHVQGQVQDDDCLVCHTEAGTHMDGVLQLADVDGGDVYTETTPLGFRAENITLADSKTLASFCLACHDADGANGDTTPFSDGQTVPDIKAGTAWVNSAHKTGGTTNAGYGCMGDGSTTGCHATAHGSENIRLLNAGAGISLDSFCYNCHTEGIVTNNAISGSSLADDIEQIFSAAADNAKHNLGATFSIGGNTFTNQCTTCHNPHVVTGKYWEADQNKSPVTRPDFSDPTGNPRAVGSTLWGDETGEKMDDFAGSGTYRTPNGDLFSGSQLPDYATFCLDCHAGMEEPPAGHGGISWGGAWNYHGTDSANVPNGGGVCPDWYTCGKAAGWDGDDCVGDEATCWPVIPRGKGEELWSRPPYNQEERIAGANFVLSCTDCHEGHGSGVRSMIRSKLNDSEGSGTTIWNSSCNACHYYYSDWHAGMSCGNASCHVSDGSDRMYHTGTDTPHDMGHRSGDASTRVFNPDLVLDMRFENNLNDSGTWRLHGKWMDDIAGSFAAGKSGQAVVLNGGNNVQVGTRDAFWSTDDGKHGTWKYTEMKFHTTLEAWVYPTDDTKGEYSIFTKHTGYSNGGYAFTLQKIGGALRATFNAQIDNNGSAQGGAAGVRGAYSSVSVPLNQWTHVAATFDTNGPDRDAGDPTVGRIRIYVNGEDVTTSDSSGNNVQPGAGETSMFAYSENSPWNESICYNGDWCASEFSIGGFYGWQNSFVGRIDEARVWNITKDASYFSAYDSQAGPYISQVEGLIGGTELTVIFSEGVYGSGSSALDAGDFSLTDANGDNPRTITAVAHTAGESTATVTMSQPLTAADIGADTLAAVGSSVFDEFSNAAGTDAVTIGLSSVCPASPVSIPLNDPPGSSYIMDTQNTLYGVVNGAGTLTGNEFSGDGASNYIDFEYNNKCLQADRKMTLEARINPSGLEGTANYVRRVLARDSGGNYQMSVWRNNGWTNYNAPDGVASIALWVSPVDAHGGKAWKPVLTDYDTCPIVSDHWYQVKAVWDSDIAGGIPGKIYVDDQGTDGAGAGENWSGYIDCTNSGQTYNDADRQLHEGDEISPSDGGFVIGANVNNHANNVFDGLIDWITWEDRVD